MELALSSDWRGWETVGRKQKAGAHPASATASREQAEKRGGTARGRGGAQVMTVEAALKSSAVSSSSSSSSWDGHHGGGKPLDEETSAKLKDMLFEYMRIKCEESENCELEDFDESAREGLLKLTFLQAMQALEHYVSSISSRIVNRAAYFTGILRGQERHWQKSRAAASYGSSDDLLAMPGSVLVSVGECCLRGNCMPSDFTPEVVLSLQRLPGGLALKAIDAFNANKRISAGARGGVVNRPRFFQRLIQNVSEQASAPDTASAASTPTNGISPANPTGNLSNDHSNNGCDVHNNNKKKTLRKERAQSSSAAVLGRKGLGRQDNSSSNASNMSLLSEPSMETEDQDFNAWNAPLQSASFLEGLDSRDSLMGDRSRQSTIAGSEYFESLDTRSRASSSAFDTQDQPFSNKTTGWDNDTPSVLPPASPSAENGGASFNPLHYGNGPVRQTSSMSESPLLSTWEKSPGPQVLRSHSNSWVDFAPNTPTSSTDMTYGSAGVASFRDSHNLQQVQIELQRLQRVEKELNQTVAKLRKENEDLHKSNREIVQALETALDKAQRNGLSEH